MRYEVDIDTPDNIKYIEDLDAIIAPLIEEGTVLVNGLYHSVIDNGRAGNFLYRPGYSFKFQFSSKDDAERLVTAFSIRAGVKDLEATN